MNAKVIRNVYGESHIVIKMDHVKNILTIKNHASNMRNANGDESILKKSIKNKFLKAMSNDFNQKPFINFYYPNIDFHASRSLLQQ